MSQVNLAELADLTRSEGGVPGEYRNLNYNLPAGKAMHEWDCMVIGEAPGPEEAKKGRPFIGRAGKLMDLMMDEAGIHNFYITNISKTFPGYNKYGKIDKPTKEDKERWRPILDAEIEAVRPTKILLLGEHACKLTFPGQWKMANIVGTKVEQNGITYWAGYHPAGFLYNQGTAANTRNMNKQRRVLQDVKGEEKVEYAYRILPEHRQSGLTFLDIETEGGTDPRVARITEWSLLPADAEEAVLSFDRSLLPPKLDEVCFHHSMHDYPILVRYDPAWLLTKYPPHDTMVMAYVLGFEDLSLKGLCNQLFGIKVFDYKNRHECGKEIYNAQDVFLDRRLFNYLLPLIDGSAYDIDRSIIKVLTWAELFGGYEIDQKRLREAIHEAEVEKTFLEKMFNSWFPGINMGSPAQLLGVLPVKDTQAETLKALDTAEAHVVLRWRAVTKDLTTYLYPYRDRERVSGLYRLTLASGEHEDEVGGTRTGRLSSYDPNMQNLDPVFQRCLRAPAKHDILRADYSQIELRCIAEITQDKRMIAELKEGKNFHEESAKLLGLPYADGKTWNFARWYGAGAPLLAQRFGKPIEAVQEMMRLQDEAYPGQKEWGEQHWAQVQATGFSVSPPPFKHRRKIHLFNEGEARKQALNHPAQCHAVYITKAAMAEIGYEPGELEFVNQVHDEVHYIVPKGDKKKAAMVKEAMMEVGQKYLPSVGIDVKVQLGRYWE